MDRDIDRWNGSIQENIMEHRMLSNKKNNK